jgi:hypothetical protein
MSPLRRPAKQSDGLASAHRGPDPARLTVRPGQASHESFRSKSHFKGEAPKFLSAPRGSCYIFNELRPRVRSPRGVHKHHRRAIAADFNALRHVASHVGSFATGLSTGGAMGIDQMPNQYGLRAFPSTAVPRKKRRGHRSQWRESLATQPGSRWRKGRSNGGGDTEGVRGRTRASLGGSLSVYQFIAHNLRCVLLAQHYLLLRASTIFGT